MPFPRGRSGHDSLVENKSYRVSTMFTVKTAARRFSLISLFALVGIFALGNTATRAQSDSSDTESVEVPAELSPEAIQSLVSKLDEKQTLALVDLIGLISSTAGNEAAAAVDQGPSAMEIISG